jgi:hypothetical protein
MPRVVFRFARYPNFLPNAYTSNKGGQHHHSLRSILLHFACQESILGISERALPVAHTIAGSRTAQ